MDMSGKDTNVEPQKDRDNPVNYHSPNLTNTSIGMIPIGNSMVESWDHSTNGPSLGYNDVNAQNSMLRANTFLPTIPGMISQSLPHFPADSDFIERAARFSCFSGGNFSEMMNNNPFSIPDPLNPYSRVQGHHEVFGGNGSKTQSQSNEMNVVEISKNEKKIESFMRSRDETKYGEAEFSGRGAQEESSGKGLGSKKRKKIGQDNEDEENNEVPLASIETGKDMEIKQKSDQIQNPTSTNKLGGKNGKQGSQGSDQPKEDYIHIRARRGQATNSHSLAERVRREKISERMKFLQDIVPGCNKVTGKAVMLDEIINYVQSLQRQVEFLSMKLATVNPRLDFNIEGLLAKDILQPRTGLSSSLAFPHEMTMPFPQLTETLQRPINFQPTNACGGFKETTSQVWEDELHNIIHMGFNSSPPLNSQDLSGSLPPPGHMKAEP